MLISVIAITMLFACKEEAPLKETKKVSWIEYMLENGVDTTDWEKKHTLFVILNDTLKTDSIK